MPERDTIPDLDVADSAASIRMSSSVPGEGVEPQ